MCMIGAVVKVISLPADNPRKGYRAWLRLSNGALRSYFRRSRWSRTKTKMVGNIQKNNLFGFWAFNTSKQLKRQLGMPLKDDIHGSIVGWGRVIVHERGFRCQYAKVLRLDTK